MRKDPIPVSPDLSELGNIHAHEFVYEMNMTGHLHSWSTWKYNASTAHRMHDQPRLHTTYTGNGYEVAVMTPNASATAEELLENLLSSLQHRDVILNEGIWSSYKWGAMGVGYRKPDAWMWPRCGGYAVYMCIWFGVERE